MESKCLGETLCMHGMNLNLCPYTTRQQPALVAHLDVRLTGDQEVAGSTSARLVKFFRGDLIMKYFLWSVFPSGWFKNGSCQFLANECA